jgi:hypothetical protein
MIHSDSIPPDEDPHYDSDTDSYYVHHNSENGRLPSESVVEAVATARDADPAGMAQLYETIDPDALDALFGQTSRETSNGSVSFRFAACTVTVTNNGWTIVSPTRESAP